MIRVVLTVLVAVALLAAAMPAVETARTATTVETMGAETDRLARAIGGLVDGSAPVAEPAMAARATRVVRVPTGFTAADVDRVALVESRGHRGGPDGPGTSDRDDGSTRDRTATDGIALAFRIDGGSRRSLSIGTGPVPVDVELVGGPIELRPAGESRLDLRYVDDDGPTVRVARRG